QIDDVTKQLNSTAFAGWCSFQSHPFTTTLPLHRVATSSSYSPNDRSYSVNDVPSSLPSIVPPLPPKTIAKKIFPPCPDFDMLHDSAPPLPPRMCIQSRTSSNVFSVNPGFSRAVSRRTSSSAEEEQNVTTRLLLLPLAVLFSINFFNFTLFHFVEFMNVVNQL
ncbi:hypothetical protein DICVIV_09233, partial [Dictyocaulus viviparus]